MTKRLFYTVLVLFISVGIISAQENPVHWKFSSKKVSDCEYDLIFSASIDNGWHLYSLNKSGDDGPNPTVFKFNKSAEYELVGKVKQGNPVKEYDKVFEMNVEFFKHSATFTQRVKLLTDAKVKVTGKYEFQSCTEEKCIFPPADKFEIEVQGSASCKTAGGTAAAETPTTVESGTTNVTQSTNVPVDNALCDCVTQAILKCKGTKNTTNSTSGTGGIKSKNTDPKNLTESKVQATDKADGNDISWLSIFFKGLLGGLAALLTPCVFPLIPMNVSFFLKRSKTKAEGRSNALIYALSIIIIFVSLGLGVSLIFGAGALHSLSTGVVFNLIIFVLLLVFAASFLGAFEIVLPARFVNKIDSQSDKGGLLGIFFMALTLVVVSFSCTGVIVGTVLVDAAASGKISGPFWVMFGFSMGLAIPFGFFAFFPSVLTSIPKSGGWLNAVKVTLGFLELALALKFASNADLVVQAGILTREVYIGLWIVIFALLTLYLLGLFKTAHDSEVQFLSVTRIFFAIFAFFTTIYLIPGMWGAPLKLLSGILPPLEYSESPHGFGGGNSSISYAAAGGLDEEFSQYMDVNKNGIVHFKNDYEHALAYAKKVGKPLMIDFTGHACANCRKTEDYVWSDNGVANRLNNDVVLVSLYVDDKRELDPSEYMTVQWYGKERQITDIGDKFKYMQETLYGQSTQPLYVLLDHNEKVLNEVRGYDPSIPDYINWMDEGITKFKASQK